MNFDDLKSSYQTLSFRAGDKGNIDFSRKVEDALEQVRKEDIKDKQKLLMGMILMAGFGASFSILGILNYIKNPEGSAYWGYLLYIMALITAIPFLIKKYQRIKVISYDVPVVEFIEKTEKRFALFQTNQLWLIPFLLIIDASFVFLIARSAVPTTEIILKSQFFFIMLVMFALLVRVIAWRRKLLILDEFRRIKQSLK
jgi:hypothetical protein